MKVNLHPELLEIDMGLIRYSKLKKKKLAKFKRKLLRPSLRLWLLEIGLLRPKLNLKTLKKFRPKLLKWLNLKSPKRFSKNKNKRNKLTNKFHLQDQKQFQIKAETNRKLLLWQEAK